MLQKYPVLGSIGKGASKTGEVGLGNAKFKALLVGDAIIRSCASAKKLVICCLLIVEFLGPLSC